MFWLFDKNIAENPDNSHQDPDNQKNEVSDKLLDFYQIFYNFD